MKVERVIGPGIYRMENGSFRVVARVGDRKTGPRPKEKRFPKDTALKTMKAWQEDQRAALRHAARSEERVQPRARRAEVQDAEAHGEVASVRDDRSRLWRNAPQRNDRTLDADGLRRVSPLGDQANATERRFALPRSAGTL